MSAHPLLEEVDAPDLAAAMAAEDPPLLVDVRTDAERSVAAIQPSLHIGLDRFVERAPAEIPKQRDVVVYCHVGARSAQAAIWLKANGWPRVRSLAGGIDAWSEQVDPDMPRYR
ncbi:MAG TPA: rhodanese-like domain-containing protein [Actinomycetota bacterium]|jgi:rhodanese-related sulfurtransferase|nr:rhodanese-like domain-containing protein [Actinomycetota bacterium]